MWRGVGSGGQGELCLSPQTLQLLVQLHDFICDDTSRGLVSILPPYILLSSQQGEAAGERVGSARAPQENTWDMSNHQGHAAASVVRQRGLGVGVMRRKASKKGQPKALLLGCRRTSLETTGDSPEDL